jgi:hypothetical protein
VPLSISSDRIKERCSIVSTGNLYESRINIMIGEMLTAYQRMLEPIAVEDISLSQTLSVGVSMLLSAEFYDYLDREPGVRDTVTIGELRIEPPASESDSMRKQGWDILRPFLRKEFFEIGTHVWVNRRDE